jgi:hypothetical protein
MFLGVLCFQPDYNKNHGTFFLFVFFFVFHLCQPGLGAKMHSDTVSTYQQQLNSGAMVLGQLESVLRQVVTK